MKGLGARSRDIIKLENVSFSDLSEWIRDMREEIFDNFRNNETKTLIFVYYAGHGVMKKMTEVVCNGGYDKKGKPKFFYPLE